MSLKTVRNLLWLLVLAFIGLNAYWYLTKSGPLHEAAQTENTIIPEFALIDQYGKAITNDAWRNRPLVVFFGFTHCPDFCPVTLVHISTWLDDLGEAGKQLAPYFITVDPVRDTPEIMARYIGNFSDRIIGITGSENNINSLTKSLGIYAKKVPQGDDYTVDHTASILLIKPDGALLGTIAYGEPPEIAKQKLLRLAERL